MAGEGTDHIVLVSADGHGAAPPEHYRPYFEARYQSLIEELIEENEMWQRLTGPFTGCSEEVYELIDPDRAMRDGGWTGAWDPHVRLREMDREGVAAEVMLHNVNQLALPFFGNINRPWPAEYRLAGSRAYNRWLADFITETRGRVMGTAQPGPCLDMAEAVREIGWSAEHGLKGIGLPRITDDPSLPPLNDPYYEPYWSEVEATGLVLQIHAGYGKAQGEFHGFLRRLVAENLSKEEALHELTFAADSPLLPDMRPRRALWQLMLGGVFDRHPGLKLVFTEVRADWIPATLEQLDRRFEEGGTNLAKRPSEYWQENCYVAVSFPHKCEIPMRHEIGIRQFMFGRDYPHSESTWPNTLDWIRDSMQGVPESEARLILGGNAIECFGLDRAKLEAVAREVGPLSADLLGRDFSVDPRLIDHFQERGGYLKEPEDVDVDVVARLFDEDLAYS